MAAAAISACRPARRTGGRFASDRAASIVPTRAWRPKRNARNCTRVSLSQRMCRIVYRPGSVNAVSVPSACACQWSCGSSAHGSKNRRPRSVCAALGQTPPLTALHLRQDQYRLPQTARSSGKRWRGGSGQFRLPRRRRRRTRAAGSTRTESRSPGAGKAGTLRNCLARERRKSAGRSCAGLRQRLHGGQKSVQLARCFFQSRRHEPRVRRLCFCPVESRLDF